MNIEIKDVFLLKEDFHGDKKNKEPLYDYELCIIAALQDQGNNWQELYQLKKHTSKLHGFNIPTNNFEASLKYLYKLKYIDIRNIKTSGDVRLPGTKNIVGLEDIEEVKPTDKALMFEDPMQYYGE